MLSEQKQAQSGGLQQTPAAWLRKIVEDNSPPPKLFAWTAANITFGPPSPPEPTANNSAKNRTDSQRIYVLGVGNLGRLLATGLSQIPAKPPITLVVHRKSLLEYWDATPGIEMTRHGKVDRFTDFDVEWWTDEKPTTGPIQELTPIKNLIVATKATDVMPQIDKLRRYLDGASTIAFVQNGMCNLWPPAGELYQRLRFADHARPSWLACMTTHGVTSLAPFRSVHVSMAAMSIGPVSANVHSGGTHHYLLSQIAQAPHLAARVVSAGELWASQLEKLVVNSVINPLSAIMDCENGEIFLDRGDMLPQVVDALIREASIVLTSLVLGPVGQKILGGGADDVPSRRDLGREAVLQRVSFFNLRLIVYDVGYKVRTHISSMLQDVRAGKQTEIQECNGWLLKAAESLNLGSSNVAPLSEPASMHWFYCKCHPGTAWNVIRSFSIFGSALNAQISGLYLFAVLSAVQAHKGEPLSFPGSWSMWQSPTPLSTPLFTGYLSEWAVLSDACQNQAFNAVDGNGMTHERLFAEIARWYGNKKGVITPPEDESRYSHEQSQSGKNAPLGHGPLVVSSYSFKVFDWAQEQCNKAAWKEIMDASGGKITSNPFEGDVVKENFQLSDVFFSGTITVSMNNARRQGWTGFVDTLEAAFESVQEMVKMDMLPPVVVDAARPLV